MIATLCGAIMLAAGCASGDPPAGQSGSGRPATTGGSADAAGSPSGGGADTSDGARGTRDSSSAPPAKRRELPRGGSELFPTYRLIGFAGGPGVPAFGRLGIGLVDHRAAEIERLGRRYAAGRRPQPVFELITVVAQAHPGRDGKYRARVSDEVIDRYLRAARRHRALLLLNVQPGRSDFLDEVRGLERWLVEPDVGLALDPEWAVGPRQVPGRVFGRTSGHELDAVSRWLSGVVQRERLPQKPLVIHQLSTRIVTHWHRLRRHPGVVPIVSVDGIGSPAEKRTTWEKVIAAAPSWVRPGFKLFYEEDARGPSRIMLAREVLALRPRPDYVLYE